MVNLKKFQQGKGQQSFWWCSQILYEQYRKKIYNCTKWRKVRLIVLDLFPFCNVCEDEPSEDVDHIKPLFEIYKEGLDPYDLDLLQGICKRCHGKKSIEDKKRKTF